MARSKIEEALILSVNRLREVLSQYKSRPSPYSQILILGITLVFFLQFSLARLLDASSVEILMPYLFINYPLPLWILAPFLHRDLGHLLVNVSLVVLLLPLESRISKKTFASIIIISGYLATYAAGLYLLAFGNKPNVSYYGTSGFVYGLSGFALLKTPTLSNREDPDWITFLVGFSALIVVVGDLLSFFESPLALNPGHVFGFLGGVGIWTALKVRTKADITVRSP